MYYIFIDSDDVETLTPDWPDAQRTFARYVREYPDCEVAMWRVNADDVEHIVYESRIQLYDPSHD